MKKRKRVRIQGFCSYCGLYRRLTLDHVVPKCKNGRAKIPACGWCNGTKGNKSLREWLAWIEKKEGNQLARQFFLVPMWFMLEAQEMQRIEMEKIKR